MIPYFNKLSEALVATEVSDSRGLSLTLSEGARRATEMMLSVKSSSRKVMLIGNGGSASIVGHMQNDLCKAAGLRAMVFMDAPLLTALSNDNGYATVFEYPVDLWAEAGDLLIAVSSSGESDNILRAVKASLRCNCGVITLSGFSSGNSLRHLGGLNFYVPSRIYGLVEVAHSAIGHFLTDCTMPSASDPDAGPD